MTLTLDSITLVASSRPPMPTSSTARSTRSRAKCSKAIAVSISKKLGCQGNSPWLTSRSAVRSTRSCSAVKSSSLMDSPFTRIRSFMHIRCGEVYKPVFNAEARRIEPSAAAVDPLPLVPAISTPGERCSGFPSAARSTRMWARSNL